LIKSKSFFYQWYNTLWCTAYSKGPTRRKKENHEYCGTHLKGTPHGIIDNQNEPKNTTQKIEVFTQDIKGIIYFIDNVSNVYKAEDIVNNVINPKIIAKYVKNGDIYSIPELNI
jgi:hypothetical protein